MKIYDIIKNTEVLIKNIDYIEKIKDIDINKFYINSKEVTPNSIFIALKGENTNGEFYCQDAINNGAILAVVSKNYTGYCDNIIMCEDTILFLKQLAIEYLKHIKVNIIAVTGSFAKTSTKDLIYHIISKKFNISKSIGNFNNEIGLPLMILNIDKNSNYAVVELGIDKVGDMQYYCDITKHNLAVITYIGTSHIGNFRNRNEIYEEKIKIASTLDKNGYLFINNDDEYLKNYNNINLNIIKIGKKNNNDNNFISYSNEKIIYENNKIFTKFNLYIDNKKYDVKLPIVGIHNVKNICFAIAVAKQIGMNDNEIINSFNDLKPTPMRFEPVQLKNGKTIINDCYNASLESILSAYENFSQLKFNKKLAIIGDVLECGIETENIHKKIGKEISKFKNIKTYFVGNNVKFSYDEYLKYNSNTKYFIDKFDLYKKLNLEIKNNEFDSILLKASRGMKFEEIIDKLNE